MAPITIEVEYLSEHEMKDHLRELVWSYRKLFVVQRLQAEGGARDDAGNRNISEKDLERIERESEHAWGALEAAFTHQRRFSQEMLRDSSENAAQRITDQLVLWAKDIEWPEGGSDGKWTSTAQSADECCAKTSIFMGDRLWPFTKMIRYDAERLGESFETDHYSRVFIDSPVLRTGIILADLPGKSMSMLHCWNLPD